MKDNPLSFNKPSVVHFGIDAVATKTLQGNVLLPGKLHPIEEGLLIKALNKLEASIDKESYIAGEKLVYPNNIVLIDIFPRKADVTGLVNRIGKEEDNDNTEVHTVVLWKVSGSKITLIDPTKKGFSSFLEGTYSSQSGRQYEVISGQSDNTQFYSDGDRNKGYSSYEDKDGKSKDSKFKVRDCTDIAVKIAFELNEKQHNGQQSSKTLSSLTVENIKEQALEQISNKKVMDNGLKSVNTRALQSSKAETRADAKKTANDFIELKSYFLDKNKPLEKIFNYNDKTLREIAEINQLALELKALPPESLELLILEEKKEEKTEVKKEDNIVLTETAVSHDFLSDLDNTETQDVFDGILPFGADPYEKSAFSMFHNGGFGGLSISTTNADSYTRPIPDYNEGYNGVKYAYSLVSSTFNSFFEKLYMAETKKIVDNIKTLKLNKKTLSLIDDAINSINELGEGEYQYAEGFNPKFGLNTLVRLKEKFKKLFDDVYKKVKNLCEEGDAEQLGAFLTQNTFVDEMLSHNEGELGTIACQLGHSAILKLLYEHSAKADYPISDFSESFLRESISSYQVSCVKFLLPNEVDFKPILKELLQLPKGKLFKEVKEGCDIADLLQRQESIKQELINHLKTTSAVEASFYQGWLYYQNESYQEALKSFESVEEKETNANASLKLSAIFYEACCAQYLSMSSTGDNVVKYKDIAKEKFVLLRDTFAKDLPQHIVIKIGQHIDSLEGMSKTDDKVDGLVKTISKNTLLEKHSIVSNDDFKQKVDNLLISRSDFQKAKSLLVELQNSLLNAKFVKLLKVFPEAVILWDIFKDVLDDETFKEKIKFSAKEIEEVHVYSEAKEIIDNALEIIGEIASGNVVEPIEFIL